MKLATCWCGSESFSEYSSFSAKLKNKSMTKINIVKCNNCKTVRMHDNGLTTIPDYETAYEYEKISGRHLRSISIIREFHKGQSILDIGCNTGMLLNEIKNQIPSLTVLKGIDLDSNAIKIGRKKFNLDLESIDAEDLSETYDNIVLCHTLEHVPNLKKFATTLDRLLNPGGRIFISVPNIHSLGAKYLLRFWPALSPEFHLWYFDLHSLTEYFKTFLPDYILLHSSSYFIWKPFLWPNVYWKYFNKNIRSKYEQKMKGDQLDVVLSKPNE